MRSGRGAGIWAIGLLVACLAGSGWADVTVERRVTTDGFGPSKFGAMEGKEVTAIANDRARTENQVQFQSKLLRALAHGSGTDTVRIIRLDQELEDVIDVPQKQYSETTFQQMRAQMHQALQGAQSQGSAPPPQQQAPTGAPVDESKCQWSPARSELLQSGEHASVAGLDASRATITVTTTCTDNSTGASCDFVFLLDQWMAADVPGTAETREFWSKYAKKLDLSGEVDRTLQVNSAAVFERYKGSWGEAIKQAGSLKGYPVKSIFAMQFGGPKCKSADSSGSSANASGTADNPPPASSTPTTPSGLAGNLAMNLFNKVHKKDDTPPAGQSAPPPGMVQLFQMTSETLAVRTDALPAAMFDVPTGYKKVDKAPPPGP
ncbi:MAG: hypothetical protein ABSH23_01040 [Steroidobacteraceae bacterium]|jgi:hypothetical protein